MQVYISVSFDTYTTTTIFSCKSPDLWKNDFTLPFCWYAIINLINHETEYDEISMTYDRNN